MKNPASFQTVTTISAGSAVRLLPSQLWRREAERARDLLEQPVLGREEEQPDVRHRDHRQHRRREVRQAQQAAPGEPAVDPERHRERDHDRQRDRAERVPEVVGQRLPEDRVVDQRAVVVEPDEHRRARRSRRRKEAVPEVGDRRIVREEREQRQRRQQQQPAVDPLGRARHRIIQQIARAAPPTRRRILRARSRLTCTTAAAARPRAARPSSPAPASWCRSAPPAGRRSAPWSRAGCHASTARPSRTAAGRARPRPAGNPATYFFITGVSNAAGATAT